MTSCNEMSYVIESFSTYEETSAFQSYIGRCTTLLMAYRPPMQCISTGVKWLRYE